MNPGPTRQTAEEFMDSFFREKAALKKLDNQMRGAFEAKFFSAEIMKYIYDLRDGNEGLNQEILSSMTVRGDVATVVTTNPVVGRQASHRYHLWLDGERWQIFCTESTCSSCGGSGPKPNNCTRCGGTGWKDCSREKYND